MPWRFGHWWRWVSEAARAGFVNTQARIYTHLHLVGEVKTVSGFEQNRVDPAEFGTQQSRPCGVLNRTE